MLLSHENLGYNFTGHVGQSEMSSLEFIGQPLVIDTQALQDGRLQVVHMDWILEDVVTIIIGLAQRDTPLEATPRRPHCEAPRVMIPSIVGFR